MPKVRTAEKTARQRKADIMRWLGFDNAAQYNKAYDKFRNRVRNFERVTGAKPVSPAYLFHDYAYSVAKKGGQFSGRVKAVLAAPTTTTTGRISELRKTQIRNEYLRPFTGLMARSPQKTAEIIEAGIKRDEQGNITSVDTERIVQALNNYAKLIKEKKDKAQKEVIPYPDPDLYED